MDYKMSYRQLLNQLQQMTDEQLDCDVTVEDTAENECYPASIYFAGEEHDSLDENHPIICF